MPPHIHHQRFVSEHKRISKLSEACSIFSAIVSKLQDQGCVSIKDTKITPNDPLELEVIYEKRAKGEFALKLEMKWGADGSVAAGENFSTDDIK